MCIEPQDNKVTEIEKNLASYTLFEIVDKARYDYSHPDDVIKRKEKVINDSIMILIYLLLAK